MNIPSISDFDQTAFKKYFKNTGWLMIGKVGSLIIKILIGFAVTNYLGPLQNGILNFPVFFTSFFIAIAAIGLDGFVTRELLKYPPKSDIILGTAFRLKLIAGLIILPVIWLAFQWYKTPTTTTPDSYIIIVGLTGILQSFNIIDAYFQAQTQGKYVMKAQILSNLVSAFIKFLLIAGKASLLTFVWIILVDAILLASGYLFFYQKAGQSFFRWKFDWSLAKHLLKNSWPLMFSAIMVNIYMKIDQVMIDHYLGTKALGIYSTVVSLSESWYFIPIAIVTAVFPALMNARRDDPIRYRKRLQNLYDLMVWISLSIALPMSIGSLWIYHLVYTSDFWAGASVLSIHVWAGVFVFLGTASGQYLIAEGYTRLSMLRTAAGAIVNIVLNLLWLPKYGIIGAAYATLIAYAVATFLIILIPKTRQQGLYMVKALLLISPIKKLIH